MSLRIVKNIVATRQRLNRLDADFADRIEREPDKTDRVLDAAAVEFDGRAVDDLSRPADFDMDAQHDGGRRA